MSNGSSSLSLDHHHHNNNISPSDHLCYVHCNLCNTVLAVSVPGSSLLKTVTVRCGHCSSLLPVNMRALLIPPPSPTSVSPGSPSPNFSLSHHPNGAADSNYMDTMSSSRGSVNDVLPRPPMANKPPEKRQRVPSAYNRFIKEEIQRIKAGNPDIAHREAFSAAAKNWAHFPHIHFGLMSEQTAKRTSITRPRPQGDTGVGMNVRMKDGLFAASTTFGVSPY